MDLLSIIATQGETFPRRMPERGLCNALIVQAPLHNYNRKVLSRFQPLEDSNDKSRHFSRHFVGILRYLKPNY
jgi:hypothetical protein